MLPRVQVEWCEPRTDIYCIVCSKLCQWKLRCPGGRTVFNVRPQKILEYSDGDLRLPICLWMEGSTEPKIRSEEGKHFPPELAHKAGISV